MAYTGFVLRDLSGYEWAGDSLRAKNHAALVAWKSSHGGSMLRVPTGFEQYDPFESEPALFQIAARIPFGDGQVVRAEILKFANCWGDIQAYPDSDGTLISIWNNYLNQIKRIAALVGRTIPDGLADDMLTLVSSNIETRYKVGRQFGQLRSTVLVEGLFSSLVVQAIEAVVNKSEFIDCRYCGTPISVSGSRKGKIFCSDSCRVLEYRRRKATAVSMRHNGRTLREIAAATHTPVKQLKKWLGE